MRRELSSVRPETAGQTAAEAANHHGPTSFRALATRKAVIGTAAFAALAAAAGLGVAAPAMTTAANTTDTSAAATAAAKASAFNLKDSMTRTVASGLGSADLGGAWSPWGATFSVSRGKAHMGTPAGVSARATLESVQTRDESMSVTFVVPTVPTSGAGSYFGVMLRRQANGDSFYSRVKVAPGGLASLSNKLTTGATTVDVGTAVNLPGTFVAGKAYVLDAVITGGASTTVKSRVHLVGTTAPSWQVAGTAAVSGGLGVRGSMGIYSYASSTGTRFDVDVNGVRGTDLSAPVTTSPTTPAGTPTSDSPTGTPTSDSPSSTPTSPSGTPTSDSPSSSPTSDSPSASPTDTDSPVGGINFSTQGATSTDPTDPTTDPTDPTTDPTDPTSPPAPPAGEPGPSNTGPRPGITLRVVTPGVDFPGSGGIFYPAAGQVLENLDIHGMVKVNQPNVTIRNCIIRGATVPDGTVNPRPMVDALGATNLQIVDSELAPSLRSYNNSTGINGKGYTLTRVDVHGSIDGVQVHGSNVRIVDSWIHDTSYFTSSPDQHWTPSHNDGMQIFGGANVVVTGSRFEGTTNSVLQTSPTPGFDTITGMVWSNNWLDGGACSMNVNAMSFPTLAPITMSGNRFGTDQSIHGCAIIANLAKTPLNLSGNVWDASNQPVVPSRG